MPPAQLLLCCVALSHHELLPLSLHDALPIFRNLVQAGIRVRISTTETPVNSDDIPAIKTLVASLGIPDRKSTRLNSSHLVISYAVFCFKNKNFSELQKGTGIVSNDT